MDKELVNILQAIVKAGFEVAIVGGAVRDFLAKKDISDWDFTTNARPEEILKLIKGSFYNNRFGTVGVVLQSQKLTIQITTYRTEEKYTDKRHPDVIVWGKTLEEDLSRRDFTINAMALRIENGKLKVEKDNLVDPFDGQKDLRNKLVRAVGDPDKRFREDALRLLRATRFATTLGFKIEDKTAAAIKKNAKALLLISGERIRDELFKILGSENAADGILLARDLGLLQIILPELNECFTVEQKSPQRHHIYDVGTHCVMSLRNCPSKDTITRLATLLHDTGKAKVAAVTEEGVRTFHNHELVSSRQALQIAKRLHLTNTQREKLFKLVRWHQFSVNENQTDKALRRFIRNIGIENIEDMMDLRIGDRLGGGLQQPESWRLKLFRKRLKDVMKKPFTVADLKVDGHDVMKILNIKPGPKVGEVLKMLFEQVADDPKKNNRDYLQKRLKEYKN
ncbi:hypothetical protein A3B52_00735 [Candidatus Curtissbacteria bacterium RIFCSPLOWO2_01_FULL_41_28]|uniref:HD domain-containing protein n=1 Tax=Candidatus Curtissbacteria bacterium RIFOXYA1_FULL_41_14 TaxID=1797737 RepID=A0A1F5HC06_9BACT|nr:MAG: Polynucleotide adenylyltransferase/metal dependent phosphohydrolase [Candidatus Curtissbacteria bacterium GW2011_GWB1_40_28]KKR60647.1 MAG: Polynucleotide adenylyltransferase/metal dependent phosphohydrolase [Candidatus Curtissbacteria bacterium GW2011_GWA2_40_31]KKR61692.1 MAG: Polynucleotide adenylyltransferase/metal dependent phosphohydrolase [Microgenomates group bacterium GW2011_GWC1_40_35]KKR77339.1 MAG: Polynucleotide adenylyltransferase/metal dependent phosphohydrolase [Candidatu